ncbi:SDR family NAD(P)-dependent oxidoreductase [Sphingobacterium sp. UBA5670]|uniref:SDR family NAD(P)-dependent oxidoreductase n=1 Tax=Sphingobacterium sp. UBA5670 TaxID=1947502 RepID=UPI0039C96E52
MSRAQIRSNILRLSASRQRGCTIIINYGISSAEAEEIADQIIAGGRRAIAIRANALKHEDVTNLFHEIRYQTGNADILFNNAVINPIIEVN